MEGTPSKVESGLQSKEGKDDDFYCWEECKRIYLVHYRNCGPWDDKKEDFKEILYWMLQNPRGICGHLTHLVG